jgi:holliday junction DNA helicase RuvA
MIGKLTGSFGGTTPEGLALIDVAGVGYAVRVPLPALLSLQTSLPERIALFVHTAVREDAIDLYGFFSEEELSFSGIGPKTALAVLNNAEVHALKHAIAQGDTVKLIKVFGIGKKSAERMVLELRDKLTIEVDIRSTSGSDAEVIEALLSLGYRADEAREAVKALQNKESNSVQEKLAHALKYLGSSLKAL